MVVRFMAVVLLGFVEVVGLGSGDRFGWSAPGQGEREQGATAGAAAPVGTGQ
jgi:hypothetical protein